MNSLQSSYSNEDARIDYFKKLMDPALHLFQTGVIDNLKSFGFFKAPASTKHHYGLQHRQRYSCGHGFEAENREAHI